MPKYRLILEREVLDIDQIIVEVSAPDAPTAQKMAQDMCLEFNHDCPDDIVTISANNCDGWYVQDILPE